MGGVSTFLKILKALPRFPTQYRQQKTQVQLLLEQTRFILAELQRLNNIAILPEQYQHLLTQAEQGAAAFEQTRFLLAELQRLNIMRRYQLLGNVELADSDVLQTRSSFDYQWADFHTGVATPEDASFMSQVEALLCQMTDLPATWFPGKTIVDIGCGAGRFTYGFLALGATVTGCDQSQASLERARQLCQPFAARLSLQHVNLLDWSEAGAYDLVFCFGVVHHTGNTYLAIRNAARKVQSGGKFFLMVYGFPETLSDFVELNAYEDLRHEFSSLSFADRKQALIERFGAYAAHGWFDAVSPKVNDLLTFQEITELLLRLGFQNIKRTIPNRNHHIMADKV